MVISGDGVVSVVEELIEALESDRQTDEETSIGDLEAELDRTVYDLFDPPATNRKLLRTTLASSNSGFCFQARCSASHSRSFSKTECM